MHFISLWVTLLSLAIGVFADVSITSPTLGQTFSGSGGSAAFTVSWVDSTDDAENDASLSKVQLYAIVLCTGNNNDIQTVKSFTTSLSSSETRYSASVLLTEAPNGIYFVQVYAKFESGYTIHYSNRFSLTDMSGSAATFTFGAALFSVTGGGPPAQLALNGGATAAPLDSRSFSIPYTEQTGRTRYAPMQTQPGTTITHTQYLTRHPTSAYTPYSTIRPSPNVYSTITPGWNYPVTSLFNTASLAPYPTYFYPASSRVVAASMSSAHQKRWL